MKKEDLEEKKYQEEQQEEKKQQLKKEKRAFTLIELLAVIIILGVLMIVAIPAVTSYINSSRKSAYVDTVKELSNGAKVKVNEGKNEMYDTDTTYYIESAYIKTENAQKSPYGDFVKSYIVVTYDGKGYTYYWTGVDDAGQGVRGIIKSDSLNEDDIESDIKTGEIEPDIGIGNRSKIKIIKADGTIIDGTVRKNISEEGSKEIATSTSTSTSTATETATSTAPTTPQTATATN